MTLNTEKAKDKKKNGRKKKGRKNGGERQLIKRIISSSHTHRANLFSLILIETQKNKKIEEEEPTKKEEKEENLKNEELFAF